MAVSEKWPEIEKDYRRRKKYLDLGDIHIYSVAPGQTVINMVAQRGILRDIKDPPPIRYDSLQKCLDSVRGVAKYFEASVHMPRIGCGLAGGEWDIVERLIQQTLIRDSVETFVYDL